MKFKDILMLADKFIIKYPKLGKNMFNFFKIN